jgi:lipoyl(octanoyl) transferase
VGCLENVSPDALAQMVAAQKTAESLTRTDEVKNVDSPRTLTAAWLGTVEYNAALELQNVLAAARLRDDIGDVLLLLEHPHVYTLGRGADERFVLNPGDVPVYRVSRGGQVTYHGPGQLIGYPIVKLEGAERDVIRYLRQLEQVLIATLAAVGIEAQRRTGLTGVWIGQEKIASIGVGLRRWVSQHGFALNVAADLGFFDAIVPCGIAGCRMTSIKTQGLGEFTTESIGWIAAQQFAAVFGHQHVVTAQADELAALSDRAARAGTAPRVKENGTKAS